MREKDGRGKKERKVVEDVRYGKDSEGKGGGGGRIRERSLKGLAA